MSKKALVVHGGWEGHQPKEIAQLLVSLLEQENFTVELSDTLDCFQEHPDLQLVDLVVPNWSIGSITNEQLKPLLQAVKQGTGLAGLHGMAATFFDQLDYHHMVGGQFVVHPGGDGVTYEVNIENQKHPITEGLHDFTVSSEKYYMHVDPAIEVLASTHFDAIKMPVAWTKKYGHGRVFYCSLGHSLDIVQIPEVMALMSQGMVWASK